MDEINSIKQRARKLLNDYIVYVMLTFVLVVQTVSELYRISLQNIFSLSYILDMAISIATTMMVYMLFAPIGSEKERERFVGYQHNLDRWSELSAGIRKNRIDPFSRFCKLREADERSEWRRVIVENKTLIPYSDYVNRYMMLDKTELKKLFNNKEISKTEYKALKKANKSPKIKPINPLLILCGVERRSLNDAGRKTPSVVTMWMMRRPAVILITNILINSIKPIYQGVQNADAILSMILSAFSILIAAYTGFSVGVSKVREQNDIVKNRIFFIELFEEHEQKKFCA